MPSPSVIKQGPWDAWEQLLALGLSLWWLCWPFTAFPAWQHLWEQSPSQKGLILRCTSMSWTLMEQP